MVAEARKRMYATSGPQQWSAGKKRSIRCVAWITQYRLTLAHMPQIIVHTDWRHYGPDRPRAPHKEHDVTCDGCRFHDPIEQRIHIIKLDAIGDVVRTTSLLEPLKARGRRKVGYVFDDLPSNVDRPRPDR